MGGHCVKLITSVEYLGHFNYQGLTILHFLSKLTDTDVFWKDICLWIECK